MQRVLTGGVSERHLGLGPTGPIGQAREDGVGWRGEITWARLSLRFIFSIDIGLMACIGPRSRPVTNQLVVCCRSPDVD